MSKAKASKKPAKKPVADKPEVKKPVGNPILGIRLSPEEREKWDALRLRLGYTSLAALAHHAVARLDMPHDAPLASAGSTETTTKNIADALATRDAATSARDKAILAALQQIVKRLPDVATASKKKVETPSEASTSTLPEKYTVPGSISFKRAELARPEAEKRAKANGTNVDVELAKILEEANKPLRATKMAPEEKAEHATRGMVPAQTIEEKRETTPIAVAPKSKRMHAPAGRIATEIFIAESDKIVCGGCAKPISKGTDYVDGDRSKGAREHESRHLECY